MTLGLLSRIRAGAFPALFMVALPSLTACTETLESMTQLCNYSEVMLPVPTNMVNADLIVEKSGYLGVGKYEPEQCLRYMGSFRRLILSFDSGTSPTARSSLNREGLQIETLASGTRFELVGFVAIIKRGLTTVASGRGPIYAMVLKDREGALYQLPTVNLGGHSEYQFMAIKMPGKAAVRMSPFNFEVGRDVERPSIKFQAGVQCELVVEDGRYVCRLP